MACPLRVARHRGLCAVVAALSLGAHFAAALTRDGPDVLVRATLQARRRLRRAGVVSGNVPGPLTAAACDAAKTATGAMSCSMSLAVSGIPEGCECRIASDSCPPPSAALGFTGPGSAGGQSLERSVPSASCDTGGRRASWKEGVSG